MAYRPPYPNTDDTDVGPDRGSTTGTPRWVKVFGIIVIVVVLLVVARIFIGGEHGPGRHAPSGHVGYQAPHSNVTVSSITEAYTPSEGGRG